jgi:hypothetical protein
MTRACEKYTYSLGAFRLLRELLRELTAREPLTRMVRTGIESIDSDGPYAQGTDHTGRPGEPSARELGVLTVKGTVVLCVRLGKADGS